MNEGPDAYCLTCHDDKNVYIPCNNCSNVKFCCLECKTTNQSHQYECQSIFHTVKYRNNNGIEIKLAIQVVLEALAIFKGNVENLQQQIEEWCDATNKFERKPIPTQISDTMSRLQCFMNLQAAEHEDIESLHIRMAFENIMDLPKV